MKVGLEYERLLLELGLLERRRFSALENVANCQTQLLAAVKLVEKETQDVTRLSHDSLSNHLLQLFGGFEKKLDKEKLEIIKAKIHFDQTYARKVQAQRYLNEVELELNEKQHRLRIVKETLARREPAGSPALSDKQQKRLNLQQEWKLVVEVQEAAMAVLDSINDILGALDRHPVIVNWEQASDKPLLMDRVSYQELDTAEAYVLDLETNILLLVRELRDAGPLIQEEILSAEEVKDGFDRFFDNLFSDWNSNSLLEKNFDRLKQLSDQVTALYEAVRRQKTQLEAELLLLESSGSAE